MTIKTYPNVVHETAKVLHKAGAMDATTMREFDAWCLPFVKQYIAGQIKKLRLRDLSDDEIGHNATED